MQNVSIVIDGAVERKRSQGGIKVVEASNVVVSPYRAVVGIDSEGMDSVKRLEVVEVWYQGIWGEFGIQADVQVPRVLEEAPFAHERQETELDIVVVPSQIAVLLCQGEDALVVPSSQA